MTAVDTKELFGQHGLRCTKQRKVIYDALVASKIHPTAEELHNLVSECCPGTSLATVYNTLEALCRSGLCIRLNATTGGARYDASQDDHLHCITDEGEILDVDRELAREILEAMPDETLRKIERQLGVKIGAVSVQLFGCREDLDCRDGA